MSSKFFRRTVVLGEFIKVEFFDKGVTDVTYDDLIDLWHKRPGTTGRRYLAEQYVERHVGAARDWLDLTHGITIVLLAEVFWTKFGGAPVTDADLNACCAGVGAKGYPSEKAFGMHLVNGAPDALLTARMLHNLSVAEGTVVKAFRRLESLSPGEASKAIAGSGLTTDRSAEVTSLTDAKRIPA